jgi:hypothetical protein
MFLSTQFEKFEHLFGNDRLANFIDLFEYMIMVEEFLKEPSHRRKDILMFDKWMPEFLDLYKRVINRVEGKGMGFLKFHLPLHMPKDMLKFGNAASVDSSTGESNHITSAKVTSRNTQRRSELLDEQSATRYTENLSIDRTMADMSPLGRHMKETDAKETKSVVFRGFSYFMSNDGIFIVKKKPPYKKAVWFDSDLYNDIFHFLKKHVLPHVEGERVNIMTVLNKDGVIFRGDPRYKNSDRHDWVYVDWGDDGISPAQIQIYVDLNHLIGTIHSEDTHITEPGNYALVHMVDQPLEAKPKNSKNTDFLAHQTSKLFHWAEKLSTHDKKGLRPNIGLVSESAFHAECVAVPADLEGERDPNAYLFLKPRNTWADVLVEKMTEHKKSNKKKIGDT